MMNGKFLRNSLSLVFIVTMCFGRQAVAQTSAVMDVAERKYDPAKEILSRRDLYSKHFRNDDGSYTAIISSSPVHFLRDGSYYEINTGIERNNSGTYTGYPYLNSDNVMLSYFSDHSSAGLVSITKEGEVKEFLNTRMYWEKSGTEYGSVNSKDAVSSVNGSKLTYKSIYTNVDAEYTVLPAGRKLNYIIKDASFLSSMPATAEYLVFSEDIELQAAWKYDINARGIDVKDEYGKIIYQYENPAVGENYTSGNFISTGNANEEISRFEVKANSKGITILTKVKASWLTDNSRVFPLAIDPTVNCNTDGVTYRTAQVPASVAGAYGTLAVGYSGGFYRSYASFNISGIPSGSIVSSTVLRFNIGSTTGMGTGGSARGSELRAFLSDPENTTLYPTWTSLYNAITNATISPVIYATAAPVNTTGNKSYTLGAQANADLQSQLTTGKFTVGFRPSGTYSGTNQYMLIYGDDAASTANRPYITVTYTPGCTASAPTLTATANGSSTSPQYNVNGTTVSLSQTTTGGDNCSGSWQYAWYNGANYWNGTGFLSATAVYNSSYATITPTISANGTYTCLVQASGGGGTASDAIDVNVIDLPAVTANADGTTGETVPNNVTVALTANPSGGSGCTSTIQYAWSNNGGTTFWNGSAFSGGINWNAAYENINVNLTATTTYTVYVRCSNAGSAVAANAYNTSSVTVTKGSCAGPALTAEANGGSAPVTVTVAPSAAIALVANATGGSYCDGNGAWSYAWSNDGGTTFWNGSVFSGAANYNTSFENINVTAPPSGTVSYTVYARCANNAACASTPSSVSVQVTTSCTAPSVTAKANGTATSVTVPNNSLLSLDAGAGGGANCAGTFTYAWRNGTGGNDYWNGTDFTGSSASYSASYALINVPNVTTGRTFTVLVQCDANTGCNNTSSVNVSIGSCSSPTLTARSNGNTGTVTVASGDDALLTSNPAGGNYCDGNSSWQ